MPITTADRRHGGRPRMRWTKRRLIQHLSDVTGYPKHNVRDFINGMGATFAIFLRRGQEPYIPNMGRLYVYRKKARGGRNPVTGAPLALPQKYWPRFRAGIELKTTI